MASSSNRDLIGCVAIEDPTLSISFFAKQYDQHVAAYHCANDATEIQQFFDRLPSVVDLNRVKAIVFSLDDTSFSSFSEAYNFRLECRDFCQKHGIFFCADTQFSFIFFTALSCTQTMVKEGEKVMVVQGVDDKHLSGTSLIREKNFYRYLTMDVSASPPLTEAWNKPFELVKEIKLSTFKCKKAKVTLKIDENSFYDFKVEPLDDKGNLIAENLSKLNIADSAPITTATDKARIVFTEQNFSVLLTTAKGKQYALENEDDCVSIPIYIAFTAKKPLIGKAAKEIYSKKPKFVVFDLIKLCSISNTAEDVIDPKWGFKLEKEENDTLMVTTDTVDGERRSSVEFLLAFNS